MHAANDCLVQKLACAYTPKGLIVCSVCPGDWGIIFSTCKFLYRAYGGIDLSNMAPQMCCFKPVNFLPSFSTVASICL